MNHRSTLCVIHHPPTLFLLVLLNQMLLRCWDNLFVGSKAWLHWLAPRAPRSGLPPVIKKLLTWLRLCYLEYVSKRPQFLQLPNSSWGWFKDVFGLEHHASKTQWPDKHPFTLTANKVTNSQVLLGHFSKIGKLRKLSSPEIKSRSRWNSVGKQHVLFGARMAYV